MANEEMTGTSTQMDPVPAHHRSSSNSYYRLSAFFFSRLSLKAKITIRHLMGFTSTLEGQNVINNKDSASGWLHLITCAHQLIPWKDC